jgi:hypothetical protein
MSNLSEIIDRIIDKGITLSFESNDLCCPDCLQDIPPIPASPMLTTHEVNDGNYRLYFLASVETSLKLLDSVGLTQSPYELDCCLHYEASVETGLKLAEAIDYDIPNNLKSCSTNFNSCIDYLMDSFTSEDVDRVLDKGIVEYGSISGQSQICTIKDYIDLAYNSQDKIESTKVEILDGLLDKGLVVSCYNGEMSISSVETFLKWYESYIQQ